MARAGERGIRVLLDLVPNHTSDQHPWFRERRDFYVWREGRNGGPPNNWKSNFGGPAWTHDEASGLWYLHNFTPDQPDLDWWNEDVRDAFDDILRFWMDRGVAGFRIDVAHGIVKDRELRDNPPATEDDTEHHRWLGQRLEYSMNRDEVHDVFRRWRDVCDPYGGVLLGETWVLDLERLMRFYGDDLDELHLAFNFVFLLADFETAQLAPIVAETEALMPEHAWPTWTLGNHDMDRFPTRWTRGDPGLSRCALMLLLTLRGTPVLYYGDELAMPDAEIPPDRDRRSRRPAQRPRASRAATAPARRCRGAPSRARASARRASSPGCPSGSSPGSTSPSRRPTRTPRCASPATSSPCGARRRTCAPAAYEQAVVDGGLWAYRRGDGFLVALNLGSDAASLPAEGTIAIGTRRERDGEAVARSLLLAPGEGVVLRVARA